MDMARSRLRSTSNGSLHNTYTAYGSHIPPSSSIPRGQVSTQRRPLRNVSQNSILPPSPGPLLSMLKTTTEMGNVGAFPLQHQQSPGTSLAYHRGPRPDLVAATPPRYNHKKCENFYYTDDHRPLRSYRDTTSEIISLYGYDNQPIYVAPGSPIMDDNSHRSYSITTNGSRHLPSQKSSGNLQSHSSGGGLQRPRSPFPYPTRLKRPGVRPSSPAVANNGSVDYSRMVELDRVSQRTIHGSYKSNSSNWPRRPPPLSLRSEFNRSTASLPSRVSPGPYYHGSGSHRSRTPSSSQSGASRYGRFEQQARIPADRGERSPSLTSIVGMYRRPSTTKASGPPTQMISQFYYDYSEDFDKPTAAVHANKQQPTTQVVPSHDDLGTDNGGHGPIAQAGSANIAHENEPIVKALQISASSKPLEEKRLEPTSDNVQASVRKEGDTHLKNLLASRRLSRSAPPSSQQGEACKDPDEKQEISLSEKSASKSELCLLSKTLGNKLAVNRLSKEVDAQTDQDATRCTFGQTIPDFASIFSSFDLLAKSPCFKATENITKQPDDTNDANSIHSVHHLGHLRHRRNMAAMRISTSDLSDESGFIVDCSSQGQQLNILSPEPISPARGLKVKNSIPQLMKALPPLPSDQLQGQRLDEDVVRERAKQSAIRRCHDLSQLRDTIQEEKHPLTETKPQLSKQEHHLERQTSVSKFKVRVKRSSSPMFTDHGASHPDDHTYPKGLQQTPVMPMKPKLKLKLSRSQLGQGRCAKGEAFMKVNRLKQCNSLADLALCSSQQAAKANNGTTDGHGAKAGSQPDKECLQSLDGPHDRLYSEVRASPQPSDQFNIPYPSSQDVDAGNKRSISSSNKDTLVQRQSCSSDTIPHQENGIRRKMSMFRLRIVESLAPNPAKKGGKVQELQHSDSHLSINVTLKDSDTNIDSMASNMDKSHKIKSDWMASRVKRWATDARKAVRSYVRRTLDRSPRWSE
ncbi:hypothetical protein QQS21_001556 [Conoideocrella luteorostrata]|uniref:Uncharacterized protein n=1 Tax=Conoideocrella luteorostrata TaxID=1105319 RepID=A0AAJ0CWU8_9HYPO|nr:hypothetical protein QQS21_001556 [Conoideocrella luteorostrata]